MQIITLELIGQKKRKEEKMDKIHLPKEIYERLDLQENEEIEIVDLAADSFTIRKVNARKSDKAAKWFIIPTIISALIFII